MSQLQPVHVANRNLQDGPALATSFPACCRSKNLSTCPVTSPTATGYSRSVMVGHARIRQAAPAPGWSTTPTKSNPSRQSPDLMFRSVGPARKHSPVASTIYVTSRPCLRIQEVGMRIVIVDTPTDWFPTGANTNYNGVCHALSEQHRLAPRFLAAANL